MSVPKYCCEVEPKNMPDMVVVVRCKDCKYHYDVIDERYEYHGCTNIHNEVPNGDWFCADGVRKDGDEE